MVRLTVLLLAIIAVGCCLPSEREALKPLNPKEARLYSYSEILARVRVQATAALEAFYVDAWTDLEETAKTMAETIRFLPRTANQPDHLKKTLVEQADQLREETVRLADAARAKNVQAANSSLQQIHLTIRTLRTVE